MAKTLKTDTEQEANLTLLNVNTDLSDILCGPTAPC